MISLISIKKIDFLYINNRNIYNIIQHNLLMTEVKVFKTEEDLRDHFHSIHDYVRNKFGFYGKTALQFFNFLFVLKLIEPEIEKGHFKSISKCLYSKLKKEEKGCERNQLLKDYRRIIYQDAKDDGGVQLRDSIFMSNSFADFDDSKDHLKGLLTKIDLLTPEVLEKFHVQGRVYEYFLGFITQKNSGKKSGSQIDDLGQYFTSRKIVRYCMKKVDPEMADTKNIRSMGDLFCGSGGFITEYIRFLEHKYPDKINWTKQTKNIFGADTDRDIIKSARVDIMLLTKTFSDTKNNVVSNIKRLNSTFDDDFCEAELNPKTKFYENPYLKLFYNFTNPPYGGDKGKDKNDKVQLSHTNKQIQHIAYTGSINKEKNPNVSSYLIKGDNKETLAILHGMSVLEKDGVYCGVLKEGVFFDQKFKSLRTQLIENYEVQWVISVPQSDFWNTSTKTSILIFKNSGNKTTEIKFCELQEIKNSNKFNEINPQTNKIICEFNPDNYELNKLKDADYLKIKYDELKEKDYSINFKDYIKQNFKVNEGFKVVKLGDICEFIKKSSRLADFAEENGTYHYYSSGSKILKCNEADIKNNLCIIIGHSGNGCIFLDDTFSTLLTNHVIKSNNDSITTYIYYYLKYNWEIFFNKCYRGSTVKNTSDDEIKKFEIPIPEDINTIKIYLDYLNPANVTLQTLQTLQTQKEKSICGLIKMLTMFGKDGIEWDEYRLGDIISLKAGKFNTKNMTNTGEYPFYNAGINNPIGTHNEYCFEGEKYILFIKSGGNGQNRISDTNGLALPILVKNKCSAVLDVVKIFSEKVNIDYLYFWIKSIRTVIQENAKYTTNLGHVDMEKFKNMKIRVLKPHMITKYNLDKEFDFMDKLKNDISQTLKNQEDITKQMMKLVLGGEGDKIVDIKKDVDNTSSESTNSTKSNESTKSTKSSLQEKKISRSKTQKVVESESETETNSDSNSDQDLNTDSEDDEIQLEKLGVSKSDLIQFKKLTKDGSTHWFHSPTEKIYTLNKEKKWIIGKTKLYDVLDDEIKEFKEIKNKNKTKHKKTKSSKEEVEVKKEVKVKKNKSTKSNVEITNSDAESEKQNESKGQNVLKYKTKAKSNAKYITDSDSDSEDLDKLVKELNGKK